MARLDVVIALLAAVGAVLPGAAAHAQRQDCASCVRLVPVAELSTSAAPIVPSQRQSVLRTGDGRFLVSHKLIDDPHLVVYDATGRFLRLYDARGGGPGEFRRPPDLVATPGGEIWALDQNRLVRFDARLGHIETRDLRMRYFVGSLFPLSDSSLLLGAGTTPGVPFTIGLVAADADWSEQRVVERAADPYASPIAAPAEAGGFWTLAMNGSKLRRYTERGAPSDSFDLVSPYSDASSERRTGGGVEDWDVPPRPIRTGLHDAGNGRVVVLTRVADDRWTPTPRTQMIDLAGRDENVRYDTVADVIDTATGRTIGSVRFDEYLLDVNGTTGYVYATRADADGHVVTKVYRIEVR
jgi:hypothetical protein